MNHALTFLMGLCLLVATAGHAADVNSKAIRAAYDQIAEVAYGASIHPVKGSTVKEMLADFYAKQMGDDDFKGNFKSNVSRIQTSDASGVGTATMKAALAYFTDITNEFPDDSDHLGEKTVAVGRKAVLSLVGSGVVFGYNSGGSSVCGVSFTSLLLIDPAKKTIYELSFVGGSC